MVRGIADLLTPEEFALFEGCFAQFLDGRFDGMNIHLGVGAKKPDAATLERSYQIEQMIDRKRDLFLQLSPETFEQAGIPVLLIDEEFRKRVRQISSQISVPPQTSATNAEIMLMNAMWWFRAVDALGPSASSYVISELPEALGPVKLSLMNAMLDEPVVQRFGKRWRESAFARLDVPHKVAAGLMLTDAPSHLNVPWKAVSISMPDGLCEPVRRLLVLREKDEQGEFPFLVSAVMANGVITGTRENRVVADLNDEKALLLESYVRGALLCVTEATSCRVGNHGNSASRGKRPGPVAGELYRIGSTIAIDFRARVQEIWTGEKRQGPKVQFVVRGHWRNQACGPRLSERRQQWIKPFWKGDEDMRVLLRSHQIQEPAK